MIGKNIGVKIKIVGVIFINIFISNKMRLINSRIISLLFVIFIINELIVWGILVNVMVKDIMEEVVNKNMIVFDIVIDWNNILGIFLSFIVL